MTDEEMRKIDREKERNNGEITKGGERNYEGMGDGMNRKIDKEKRKYKGAYLFRNNTKAVTYKIKGKLL